MFSFKLKYAPLSWTANTTINHVMMITDRDTHPHTPLVHRAPRPLSTGIVGTYLGIVTSYKYIRKCYPSLTLRQQLCTTSTLGLPVGVTDDVWLTTCPVWNIVNGWYGMMSLYDVTESVPANTAPKYRRNGARYGLMACVGGCVDRWSSSTWVFILLVFWITF